MKVDEQQAVDIVLQPGEMSLHHVLIAHGSEPNNAPHPRIGFAIRYLPTDVRQAGGRGRQRAAGARRRHASVISSRKLPPEDDLHPAALERHKFDHGPPAAHSLRRRGAAGQTRHDNPSRRASADKTNQPREDTLIRTLSLAAGLALLASGASAQDIKIRFAHSLSTSEPAHLAAEYFAKNVAARTNNKVQIQVFPGEQLGSGKEVNEMIRQGANVMNITDPGYLQDFVPDVGVLNGPYIVKDPKEFDKLLASDWYKSVDQKLQQAGFRLIMAGGFFGRRHVIADKPIRKPEDMQGMTVRVPPNTMWIETFKAMGARPTTVQWSEVYNALQQNVVAGRRGAARLAVGLQAAGDAQGHLDDRPFHRDRHLADERHLLQPPAQGRADGPARGRRQGQAPR